MRSMFATANNTLFQASVQGNKLTATYERLAGQYLSQYPEVKNPAVFLDGVTKFIETVVESQDIPDHTLIYVIEDDADGGEPELDGVRYIFLISKRFDDDGNPVGYALHLIYAPNMQAESVSVFEEDKVIWTPDTLENTEHMARTKYYMGFAYKLCEFSPGFDKDPEPESEITVEELLTYVTGTLPPDMIEIKLPEGEAAAEGESEQEAAQAEAEQGGWEDELFESGGSQPEPELAVPEHDDTEITMVTPEEYEEEYDDLQTDYEELFE